jgi:copper chaperone CopZ
MVNKTFYISDMHCVNCAMRLQELEDDLPGVAAVDASYQKQRMKITFDETLVNEDQIIEAVRRLGYTAKAADD